MVSSDGLWDLFTFIAYISIPLEILIVAFGLQEKLLDGKVTTGKCILLAVAFLFVSFIVCCGITHLVSFLHAVECASAGNGELAYCITTGPMSGTISFWKATTSVVSCITAIVLSLVMKQLLQFMALFGLLDTHVSDVENTLRVMLSSTDIYSTHSCPNLTFRSVSESGHWMLERAGISLQRLQESSLYDMIAEVDRPRVERQLDALMSRDAEESNTAGRDEMGQALLEDMEGGKPRSRSGKRKESQRIEYRLKAPEGLALSWVESVFVHDPQNNVVHVVTRDIEQRKDEERRRADARAVEAAQDTVQRWLHYMSCVAHDLKTPLTCFEMAIDLIGQDDLSVDAAHALTHARAACGVLRSTVAQAIEVRSSVTSGIKPTPRMTETDLAALFHTIENMVPALSISKAISVRFELGKEVPAKILSDKGWLMQMCLNLVSNSCKYTAQGSVITRARVVEGEQGNVLRIEVQDTGVGMRPESTGKLFEPFYMAQQGQGTGTGLGLYSVKLHSEALGGRCGYLPVPAQQGTGSIFFFEVPLIVIDTLDDIAESSVVWAQQPESPAHPQPLPSSTSTGSRDMEMANNPESDLKSDLTSDGKLPPPDPEQSALQPSSSSDKKVPQSAVDAVRARALANIQSKNVARSAEKTAKPTSPEVVEFRERVQKVLVVDDVDSIRRLLSARLRRMAPSLVVDVAENGLEALEKWREASQGEAPYHLIITDVVMPLMSGPEMVARLREVESKEDLGARTPIVGMSANTACTDVQEFLDTGMDAFMTKPMPSGGQELVEALLRAMR